MPHVDVVETALRNGEQTLLVSRLRQRHLLPVAEVLDGCGYAALDGFGGSTFEAQLRFLGEDPFERLRALRAAIPNTPLLASLAGQALVGHRHVSDDVVDAFVAELADSGVDIIRCHDPLNDTRNLERCIRAGHAAGRRVEGALVYAVSPVHSVERFVELGAELAALECDALCVYDPLGLLGAGTAHALVRGLIERTGLPVHVHTAGLTGQAGMAYHAALLAGARGVDTALTPLAGGASTPSTEGVLHSLLGTDFDTGLDAATVQRASQLLEQELGLYHELFDPVASRPDASVLRDQIHPVAMGHLLAELRERDRLEALADVEAEVQRVRAELGHPPLVTPIAEIVVTQAVYNVCDGDRYATISQEVKDYCLGLYGAPPGPLDPEVRRLVRGREEAITCRPGDLLEPSLERAARELRREGIEQPTRADVLSYALFPDELLALRRGEAAVERLGDEPEPAPPAGDDDSAAGAADSGEAPAEPAPPPPPADEVRELTVEVDGEAYRVRVIAPAGTFGSGAVSSNGAASPAAGAAVVREGTVVSPMQGLIVKVPVTPGQSVQLGDVVAVLEAMKMQNDITATRAGRVTEIFVETGSLVSPRDPIVHIE